MISRKGRTILLAVTMGIAVLFSSLVLLEMSPVLALEEELSGPVKQAAPEQLLLDASDIVFVVVFTDPAVIDITDLSETVTGEGMHTGMVWCNTDSCSKQTQLQFTAGSRTRQMPNTSTNLRPG